MHPPLKIKNDYLNVLLDIASERTRDRGSRVYELELGVSIRELRVLRSIAVKPGISIGEVVQACAIEKTLVSKHVSALVERDLVRRSVGDADARQIRLHLTPAGIELVQAAEPIGQEMEARFLDCLSVADVDNLRRILLRLIQAEAGSRDIFEFMLARLKESKAAPDSSPASAPASKSRKK